MVHQPDPKWTSNGGVRGRIDFVQHPFEGTTQRPPAHLLVEMETSEALRVNRTAGRAADHLDEFTPRMRAKDVLHGGCAEQGIVLTAEEMNVIRPLMAFEHRPQTVERCRHDAEAAPMHGHAGSHEVNGGGVIGGEVVNGGVVDVGPKVDSRINVQVYASVSGQTAYQAAHL